MIPESNELDPRIDAALDSYPVVPLPSGFVRRTMAQVTPTKVRFRLDFLDLVIPAFFTIFALLALAMLLWTLNHLNPFWTLELGARLQWVSLYTSGFPYWILVLTGSAGGALSLAGITAFIIWFNRLSPASTSLLEN
jgi:hypothetical protein